MKRPITIKNMDIEVFDTVIEVLNNSNPPQEKVIKCRKIFNAIRREYQQALEQVVDQENSRPNEELRLNPNPVSKDED